MDQPKKSGLAIVIGKMGKGGADKAPPMGGEEGDEERDMSKVDACDRMISAIKDGSPDDLKEALQDFLDI